MAKPDTDDGWLKLAYELDAALSYADFSRPASTILRYVRAQTFGKSKAMHARLTTAEIVERSGETRQNVDRAFRELVDSGVLVEVREHRFRFVKDYEKWTRREVARDFSSPKVPRLTPRQVADCKAAPEYAKRFHPDTDPAPDASAAHTTPDESIGIQTRIQMDSPTTVVNPSGFTARIQMDSKLNPSGFSAIEERAPSALEKSGEDTHTAGVRGGGAGEDFAGRIASGLSARFVDDNADYYRREASMLLAGGFTPAEVELAIAEAFADPSRRFETGAAVFRFVAKTLPRLAGRVRGARPDAPAQAPGRRAPAPALPTPPPFKPVDADAPARPMTFPIANPAARRGRRAL